MSLIRKPAQLTVQPNIKVLIYGQPGLGKTTLSLSSPQPVLLDFDGGIHRVNPKHQVDTLQVANWDEVLQTLSEDLSAYKTLVIDTVGKMLDFMSAYIIKNDPKMGKRDGALSLQGYGARKVMFSNFLARIAQMQKNIVFVAHDKEEKDGESKFIRPEIGGSSGGDLIKEIDLVGYMEAIGKKRTISFDPCERFYGKNTCNLPNVIELPDVVDGGKDNTLLSEIFKTYEASLEKRKAVAIDYNDLMEFIKGLVDSASDAAGVNETIGLIQGVTHIWDSKLQAGRLLSAKAKELGLKYNTASQSYEPVEEAVKTSENAAKVKGGK